LVGTYHFNIHNHTNTTNDVSSITTKISNSFKNGCLMMAFKS